MNALRSLPRSVADPLGANEHNVTGTLQVFEAARRTGVRRVVYASSSSVYGYTPLVGFDEGLARTVEYFRLARS